MHGEGIDDKDKCREVQVPGSVGPFWFTKHATGTDKAAFAECV
jgi:hypothetical protein